MWGDYLECLGLGDADQVDASFGNAARALYKLAQWPTPEVREAVMRPVIDAIRNTHGTTGEVLVRGEALRMWARGLQKTHEAAHGKLPYTHPAAEAGLRAFNAEQVAQLGSPMVGRVIAMEAVTCALALGVAPADVAAHLVKAVQAARECRERREAEAAERAARKTADEEALAAKRARRR